jgi:hypothetical protein
VNCGCGHPYEDHHQFWDDGNGMSGMGCDHCNCSDAHLDGGEGWLGFRALADGPEPIDGRDDG